MPQKPHLTTEEKAKTAGMADAGMSKTDIGICLGIGQRTASDVIAPNAAQGTVVTAPRPGRPCKTNEHNLRQLQSILQENP
jgi:transposase